MAAEVHGPVTGRGQTVVARATAAIRGTTSSSCRSKRKTIANHTTIVSGIAAEADSIQVSETRRKTASSASNTECLSQYSKFLTRVGFRHPATQSPEPFQPA